ncbi:hypothetical protein [Mesorhizobium sp. AR02]|uniref:hypothetical protein n=1 Tax=Mesorhizobium sp. AR02 TaxID=2865837 RepID=UPI00215F52CC|nr:hypothetical protein [Mesorhizobium sp. AR02]
MSFSPPIEPDDNSQGLVAAEALHLSIVKPFISPHCDHYRATRVLHDVMLKAVRDDTTGPVRPPAAP